MKDVLIISHFMEFPFESGSDRFSYIAEKLVNQDIHLEVITSDFMHIKKAYRKMSAKDKEKVWYQITTLHEPIYHKNVCFKRFYAHYILGRNLKKYLKSRKVPDVIYCAVPSLSVASVAALYAKKYHVRFIIDVQDLWPEAFKMVFHVPIISQCAFKPIEIMANKIYKAADEIIAVSETYLNRALRKNQKVKKGYSVFLGTELKYFDFLGRIYKKEKPKNEIWLTYVGTLGHSYDLSIVIKALGILKQQGINNLRLIVLGDGPLKQKFENEAKQVDILADFTGRLAYKEMVGYLISSDIAVNPIVKGAAASIINKVGDYAAAALPVINTQECQEYRTLVEDYQMGISCNDLEGVVTAIKLLYKEETLRKKMGKNNRKLAEERFDKGKTYNQIVSLIVDNEGGENEHFTCSGYRS